MCTIISITIPHRFLKLAREWHDGQDDILYAVASSGGLYLGNQCPINDDGSPMSEQEWHFSLWDDLECALGRLLRHNHGKLGVPKVELAALSDFHCFAVRTVERLRSEYELYEVVLRSPDGLYFREGPLGLTDNWIQATSYLMRNVHELPEGAEGFTRVNADDLNNEG
jgi:hypothetical protein